MRRKSSAGPPWSKPDTHSPIAIVCHFYESDLFVNGVFGFVLCFFAQLEDRATQRCDLSARLSPRPKRRRSDTPLTAVVFWGGILITLRDRPQAVNLRSRMLRLLLTGGPDYVTSFAFPFRAWEFPRLQAYVGNPAFQSSIRALSPRWDPKRVRLPHLATSIDPASLRASGLSGTTSSPHGTL